MDEAPAGKKFTLFADTKGETDTGLALVNGTMRQSIEPAVFGRSSFSEPGLHFLSLLATGNQTRVRFDNVCQGPAIIRSAGESSLVEILTRLTSAPEFMR